MVGENRSGRHFRSLIGWADQLIIHISNVWWYRFHSNPLHLFAWLWKRKYRFWIHGSVWSSSLGPTSDRRESHTLLRTALETVGFNKPAWVRIHSTVWCQGWLTILSIIQGRQAYALSVRLCEHKPLLVNALALLALPIGSAFTLLSGSEELEAPKLLVIKHICITVTLSIVRGDCRCIGDWFVWGGGSDPRSWEQCTPHWGKLRSGAYRGPYRRIQFSNFDEIVHKGSVFCHTYHTCITLFLAKCDLLSGTFINDLRNSSHKSHFFTPNSKSSCMYPNKVWLVWQIS